MKVIGGAELARYRPKSKIKGKISKQDLKLLDDQCFIKNNTVLVQNIVAHIENPIDHIEIISAIVDDPTDLIILDTINQLIPKVDHVSNRYIMALLNSQLINWYAYRFIFGKAIRTMHFDNTTTNKIPFPKAPQVQIIDQIELAITEIITKKKSDPNTDTTQLEKSIDQQIYQLYGLTATEITLVENHHSFDFKVVGAIHELPHGRIKQREKTAIVSSTPSKI